MIGGLSRGIERINFLFLHAPEYLPQHLSQNSGTYPKEIDLWFLTKRTHGELLWSPLGQHCLGRCRIHSGIHFLGVKRGFLVHGDNLSRLPRAKLYFRVWTLAKESFFFNPSAAILPLENWLKMNSINFREWAN